MTGNDVIPKRTDDGLAWIAEVGRAFSDATGWPMVFRPHVDAPEHNGSPDTCWVSEICNSDGPIGRLQIELPQDPGQDRSFMTVCELSRLVSSLVTRIVGTTETLERRNRDVTLLLEADAARKQQTSLQGLLEDYLRMCAEISGFRQAAFFLLSPDGRELHLRAAYGLPPDEVPVPRRPLDLVPPDATAFEAGMLQVSVEGESAYRRWLPAEARTGLCLSVDCDSGPAGSLWLYDRRTQSVGQDELRVIRRMADRIAAVLERVVLLHESEIHHRQNNDLQVASQCQRESGGPLLDDPAFDVAALCASRFELGGDLCEAIPLGEQRVFVAVGDASGDSVPAAMVMSAVRGAVRAMLVPRLELGKERNQPPDLSLLLQRANQTLNGLSATFQFMSLFLGIVDAAAGTLTYSNAGHPPPLLLKKRVESGELRVESETQLSSLNSQLSTLNSSTTHQTDIQELTSHGILLGIIPDSCYRTATVPFEPGDALVAYSDGISEAMDEDERIFGAQGIIDALQEAPRDSSAEILQAVVDELDRFASRGNSHGDDRTLLVLRLR